VLILTPTPLQTAAERALFAELAGWDTGSGVRGAVMASLPVVEGPRERRQADAVLFVPEGVAVVRVVEVERQTGVVTATAEGAWTIGSGDRPGDVLQLTGGGSTPLEGLMRAGMHAAVTLRKAGLEPGRIARLTVLTGPVTGLHPADGDLGEGDQVALVDPSSLLLGVARAARYAGTDNPRLWTTADVRAGIEALGVAGRTPSVEELNGEGFPYSPYVLRRPDLLTPAALNASPSRVAAPGIGPATAAALQRVAPSGPLVDPAAAARVAAAAVQAQEAAERATPAARAAAAGPATAPDAAAHPDPAPAAPVAAVAPEVPVPAQPRSGDTLAIDGRSGAGLVEPRVAADDTGGIGGLFGDEGQVDEGQVAEAPPRPRELPPELRPRPLAEAPSPDERAAPGRRRALLVAAVLALVLLVGGLGFRALTGGDADADAGDTAATSSAPPAAAAAAGPAVGDTEVVNGTTFTLQVAQTDSTCQGHAYDAVAGFFASSDCTGLSRALWSADAGGQPAVVSLVRVTMPDVANAQALRSLADTDGSGNVNDLLREDVSWDGGPTRLSRAQYASAQEGTTVTIVETSWTGTAGASSALDALASAALSLP
jgi:hypothetical protein